MIKIYRLKQLRNNVSHVLMGAGGNTMRYNFTGGNVVTGVCPELSLKSKYAQDLLEQSELFRSGMVIKVREISTSDDAVPAVTRPEPSVAPFQSCSGIDSVTTPDELLVYVNTNYSKRFTDPSKALAFAAKEGLVFTNLAIGD